jgi:hypothetical protein
MPDPTSRPAPSPSGGQPAGSLAALLGLRSDSTIAQLRWAYERAVARANRVGDTGRAEALARAYEALPAATRHQVSAPAEIPDDEDAAPDWPRPRLSVVAAAPPGRRRNRGLGYFAAVLVIVVGGLSYAGLRHPAAPTPAPVTGPVRSAGPGPAPSSSAVNGGSAPHPAAPTSVRVPLDAPHDNSGLVRVVCDPLAAQLGYTQFVPPGATVRCNNGAVPSVVP